MEEERLMILQMLSEQKITPQEAVELFRALESSTATPIAAAAEAPAAAQAPATAPEDVAAETPATPTAPAAPTPPAPPPAPAPVPGLSSLGELIEGLVSRLGTGLAPGMEYTETRSGDLTGSAPVALDLVTHNGRLIIHGWDEPGYRAVITRRVRAASEEEARRRGEEVAPFSVGPGHVSLRMQSHMWDVTMAAVELWLPRSRQYALLAKTGNGRVEVDELPGLDARVHTGNGRINILGGSWGRLDAHTGNGSLLLRTSAAHLEATTGNGSAEVAVQGRRPGEIQVNTGNGSITLDTRGAAGSGFQIDAHTGVGEIRCRLQDLEMQQSRDNLTSRRLNARSRGYADNPVHINIRVRTGVGSITVD